MIWVSPPRVNGEEFGNQPCRGRDVQPARQAEDLYRMDTPSLPNGVNEKNREMAVSRCRIPQLSGIRKAFNLKIPSKIFRDTSDTELAPPISVA